MVIAHALTLPRDVRIGAGAFEGVPAIVRRLGRRAAVVTGRASLGARRARLLDGLAAAGVEVVETIVVAGEPSPDLVDAACARLRPAGVDVVIGVGGGSALDAAKAVAAMLPHDEPVERFLEGLPGARPHDGRRRALVAVPTTAGTGSEATKNAVLSRVGPGGWKRSIRHDGLVPDAVVLDPALTLSCPRAQTAASGADAFTQCLEAFVSPDAAPWLDALVLDAMARIARSLERACGDGAADLAARADLLWGAFVSGVALAHAGLGVVHGLAGPIGGRFPAPHGAVCGTLLAAAVEANIRALRARAPDSPARERYARVGAVVGGRPGAGTEEGEELLMEALRGWTDRLPLPRLSAWGLGPAEIDSLAAAAEMKRNPIRLEPAEVRALLERRR